MNDFCITRAGGRYSCGSQLAQKTGNGITYLNRDQHEGWELHFQGCLYNHCLGMEHGAWADWKWVGKAEAGIMECDNANESDTDGVGEGKTQGETALHCI